MKQQRENFHQLRRSDVEAQKQERESREAELQRAREAYEGVLRQKQELEALLQAQQSQGGQPSAAGGSSPAPASQPQVAGSQPTLRAKGTSARRETHEKRKGKRSSRSREPTLRRTNGIKSAENDTDNVQATPQQSIARPAAPPPVPAFKNPEWLEALIERTRKAHQMGIDVNEVPPALPIPPLGPEPGQPFGAPPPPVVLPKRNVSFGVTPDRFGWSDQLQLTVCLRPSSGNWW